jgi:molybdate-binding protein
MPVPAHACLSTVFCAAPSRPVTVLPIAPEHYDFLVVEARRRRPAVQAFIEVLRDEAIRDRIRVLGMEPAAQESI